MREKRGLRRIAALVFGLLLVGLLAVQVPAATAKVTTTAVKLRAKASSSSKVKTTVPAGKYVNATGTSGNWTKVAYYKSNGTSYTGYIYSKYLKDAPASTQRTATLATAIWIRKGPGTNYAKVGVINSGKKCVITGTSGSWYKVTYNGKSGYIKQGYLVEETSTRTVATAIYLRKSPTKSAKALAVIPGGAKVTVKNKVSGKNWYLVTYNGKSGYIYGGYFTTDNAAKQTKRIVKTAVYLRNTMSVRSDKKNVVAVIPKGAEVTIVSQVSSKWYKVKYGTKTGYLKAGYFA